MYKAFIMIVLLVFSGSIIKSQAQDVSRNQVPSIVVNALKKEFPKADRVSWEMKQGIYEAEFEINRSDHEAWIDKEGNLIKAKIEMKIRSVPDAVRSTVRQEFKGYLITEAEKLIKNGVTYYKLELKTFTKEQEVVIDSKGKLVPDFLW